MALVPCDSCRRHVRSSEAACPFCKTVRHMTTAAVAAVATLAVAGCDTFSPAAKYGGPPPTTVEPTTVTPVTTDVPDAAPPSPTTSATSPRIGEPAPPSPVGPPDHVHAPVAKYGGPPRR